MTTVYDCVKDTMVNYNSAFDTRWRVLSHVFFCIGTGYYWSGNSIGCSAKDSNRRWTKERKAPLSVRDFLVHFDEDVSKRKNNPDFVGLKKDDSVVNLNRKFLMFHSEFLIDHMDELVDNNIAITDDQLPKNMSINGGNSLFWFPPETMDKDWRDALVESGTIMLELIKNHYANGDDSDTAVWSCKVSKKTYFQMKEHVELVRIKQYKSKKKKT